MAAVGVSLILTEQNRWLSAAPSLHLMFASLYREDLAQTASTTNALKQN